MSAAEAVDPAAAPLERLGSLPPEDESPSVAAPEMIEAIAAWQGRLSSAGVACRAVAVHSSDPHWLIDFDASLAALESQWTELWPQVSPSKPLLLVNIGPPQSGGDLLLATTIQTPAGQTGVIGIALAPPHNDRTVRVVLLSLGWLQLAFSASGLTHSQRAARLLELLGYVASQTNARAGAQEWINRTAAWVREELTASAASLSLTLFEVRRDFPHWWVASDTAWVEKGSSAVQEGTDVAARAVLETQDVRLPGWWAAPVVDDGKVVAVLVARVGTSEGSLTLPETTVTVLRASLALADPLLRRWRDADRSLPRHAVDATGSAWRKLTEPGHLAWKAGAASLGLGLAVLLVWPVPDRVTATTVIEGRQRQVITAPFDGFIGQVLARPGERVAQGQVLARLDDRDLKLEYARHHSELDQASGKVRQAMTDHDSPALALAQAEVQQAEAQLALVEAKLARTGLTAPLDGLLVTGDWVQQIGSPVEVGKEMFEIAAGEGYRVVLQVPDRDIARVKVGQIGTLRLTGQPQAAHEFRVSTVTATATVQDSVNGFRVEAEWQGQVPPLSPGMQGIGKVEVGTSNLLTVWTRTSIDWLRLKIWSLWW
jgi:multidrug efflux pump subunit AcrA (membrane-fusion protein)